MNFGTHNLEDLIFICFGNEYKNMKQADSILQDKYNLLKKYVHPIGYKMITWKTSGVQPKKHLNLYGTNINSGEVQQKLRNFLTTFVRMEGEEDEDYGR